jgi:DNA-binding NarL/FixJ family response regulator
MAIFSPDSALRTQMRGKPPTVREIEVLTTAAGGERNREIAARLFICARAVDEHLSDIYAKLEVHSRIQAVNEARRRNLIPLMPPAVSING